MYNADIAAPTDVGVEVTKGDIIASAYSAMRISGLTVNPTPEDLDLALMRLEAMAAEFFTRNMAAGYRTEEVPDPASDSGLILSFKEAYAYNLAMRLVADFNKQVPATMMAIARGTMSTMSGAIALARINGVQRSTRQPLGAGNLNYGTRWAKFYRTQNDYVNVNQAQKVFLGDIDDFTENFESQLDLDTFEFLSSFSVEVDSGLRLISSDWANDEYTAVTYRLEGTGQSEQTNYSYQSQVTIIATTSKGRVLTHRVLFAVYPRSNRSGI